MRVFGVFFGGRTRNKLCDVVQKGVLGGLQTQTQSGCGGGEILKRSHFSPNNTIGNDWEEIQGRKKKHQADSDSYISPHHHFLCLQSPHNTFFETPQKHSQL
jgi:hypothetical protein